MTFFAKLGTDLVSIGELKRFVYVMIQTPSSLHLLSPHEMFPILRTVAPFGEPRGQPLALVLRSLCRSGRSLNPKPRIRETLLLNPCLNPKPRIPPIHNAKTLNPDLPLQKVMLNLYTLSLRPPLKTLNLSISQISRYPYRKTHTNPQTLKPPNPQTN